MKAPLSKAQLLWFLRQQKKRRQDPVPLAQGVTFEPKQ